MSELRYLASLFFCAWVMGAVFDVYNVVTGASRWIRWLRPILDISFWILSSIFVYYVLFVTDDGRLRAYTLILLALGYGMYWVVLHRKMVGSAFLVVRIGRWIGVQVFRIIQFLLIRPVRFILMLCWTLVKRIFQGLCLVEDGLFWVLRFWVKLFARPLQPVMRSAEGPLGKIHAHWEGIWTRASNWLRE
ncbi:MAG: hypothetical protein K6T83_15280 [Alicyclobacillus sp.]|nr:hypothetical protein [Alicyclobacillus sp.]